MKTITNKQKLINFTNEFNNIQKLRMFEIPVINKSNNESDFLIFDIDIIKNKLYSTHIALTKKENKSKKIAHTFIVIDTFFSLDINLQNLYETILNKIIISDYYSLSE